MIPIIQQGDQYYVPIRIKKGETVLTEENVDGVRISFGGNEQSYPDGQLEFDGSEHWLYWLGSDVSMSMVGRVPYQISVKIGENKFNSAVQYAEFGGSLFKEDW